MKLFENSLINRCMQRCFTEQRENTLVFVAISNFGTNLELKIHMRTIPIHYLVLASILITETKLIEE